MEWSFFLQAISTWINYHYLEFLSFLCCNSLIRKNKSSHNSFNKQEQPGLHLKVLTYFTPIAGWLGKLCDLFKFGGS